jgi:hypothetical protein
MTAAGRFMDHPYMPGQIEMPGVEELGLPGRDELARQIEPKLFAKYDALTQERAELAAKFRSYPLNNAHQRALQRPRRHSRSRP